MNINKAYPCNTSNYDSGAKRQDNKIKYIVIHYTGNRNDKAVSNCKYFQSPNRNASAHFFVDENEVCQSVSPSYVAWSVGGKKYDNCASTGGGAFYGKCTNSNSVSIEITDAVDSVKEKTKKLVFELVKELMSLYNIPIENVIRHFDVNGKNCPASLVSSTAWKNFKNELSNYLKNKPTTSTSQNTSNVGTKVTVIKKAEATIEYTYVMVNGEKKKVERILVNDNNYIRIKDLTSETLSVTYDEVNKIPVITTI